MTVPQTGCRRSTLPAAPDVRDDRPLPETYERARHHLARCEEVDECKEWGDKARALASYARQADDDELYLMARRIQGRAVRRCGELLREFRQPPEERLPQNAEAQSNGAGTQGGGRPQTQREAAERAGMSKRQEVTARRVADVPEDEFEKAIGSDDPPSVTELAERGRQREPRHEPPAGPPVVQVDPALLSARGPLEGDPRGDVRMGVNAAHQLRKRMGELSEALDEADLNLAAQALEVYRIREPYRRDARRLIEALEAYCCLLADAELGPPP